MNLSPEQITIFLISISIMLTAAKLLGELCIKIKQPAIIGEIIAGIILGPTILGYFSPEIFGTLFPKETELKIAMEGITSIAVIMLLLVSGLEVDLSIVIKQGKAAFTTSILGIVGPFIVGFGIAYFLPELMGIHDGGDKLIFALFIGTALSISALPVIAKTLMDLNIFKTKLGILIIASAMVDDFLGWLIFSLILGIIGASKHGLGFSATVIFTILFTIFMLTIGRRIFHFLISKIQKNFSFPGSILNFIFIMGFLGAAFTEFIGIHAVFGAFIVGVAIGDSVHLKESTKDIIHQFVTNIFAPLFFVSIGLRVNFVANFDLLLVLIIIFLAFVGKVIGCGYGAKLGGLSKNESIVVGFGMNSRGAMEIILATLALEYGLIQETVFVALVIMALFTSVASAPFMNIFIKKINAVKSGKN